MTEECESIRYGLWCHDGESVVWVLDGCVHDSRYAINEHDNTAAGEQSVKACSGGRMQRSSFKQRGYLRRPTMPHWLAAHSDTAVSRALQRL